MTWCGGEQCRPDNSQLGLIFPELVSVSSSECGASSTESREAAGGDPGLIKRYMIQQQQQVRKHESDAVMETTVTPSSSLTLETREW